MLEISYVNKSQGDVGIGAGRIKAVSGLACPGNRVLRWRIFGLTILIDECQLEPLNFDAGSCSRMPLVRRKDKNLPQSEAEEKMVKDSIVRNQRMGNDSWTQRIVRELGLDYTLRPRGRPVGLRKKRKPEAKSG